MDAIVRALWKTCYTVSTFYIWGQIFAEFLILWSNTIQEIRNNWYTTNNNKFTLTSWTWFIRYIFY
jgi:hypothetical protein